MNSWEQSIVRVFRRLRLDSIKNKIVVFAMLATLIPSLTTAWISYVQNKSALTDKIAEELEGVATQTAREMDLWVKERLYDVRVFASSFEVSENLERIRPSGRGSMRRVEALARLNDYLGSVKERFLDYEELLVIDPEARVVASSAERAGGVVLADDWLGEVRGDRPILGEASWDDSLRQPVMTITVPILTASGTFLGALSAKLNFNTVEEILKDFAPGELGEVYLVDQDGRLVLSSRSSSKQLMASSLATELTERLFSEEGETIEYVGREGSDVVGSLRVARRLDWAVVAEMPAAEAFAQVARLRNLALLIVSVLLLVVGLIAYALGLIIVRPLDRLTKGAAEVAKGDLSVDLPVTGGGEVGYLTEVFNDMVARLREGRDELSAINTTLAEQNTTLEFLSVTDGLTGLANRRQLIDSLNEETRRSKRHKRPFAILMVDVDHFKKYNDEHGHLAGDEALKGVAAVLKESTREMDVPGRYGGEEFLILLSETNLVGAVEAAERIRTRLAEEEFEGGPVTVSIGAAEYPIDGDSTESVIASADAALYRAKHKGRDRVARATRKRAKKTTKRG